MTNLRLLLVIVATRVPGFYKSGLKGKGRTSSARYCYSIWLRHLVMAYKNGLPTRFDTVAEIGPGGSIGVGLAALLSGANRYYAVDIVSFISSHKNVKIFDELVGLFNRREDIPDNIEFPMIGPYLDSYDFPQHILSDSILSESLKQDRIDAIRACIMNTKDTNGPNAYIHYYAPLYDPGVIEKNSVDMILSQAVLEHVDDIESTYKALARWLKPGGFMSHQIDFKSHGITKQWNGHWAYSDSMWKFIMGSLPYFLNRCPHSVHISQMQKFGFEIVCDNRILDKSGIKREQLASEYFHLSDGDLTTRSVFIQSTKK